MDVSHVERQSHKMSEPEATLIVQTGKLRPREEYSDVSCLQARYFPVLELLSLLQALVGPHSVLLCGVNGRAWLWVPGAQGGCPCPSEQAGVCPPSSEKKEAKFPQMNGEAGANDPAWHKPANLTYFEVGKRQREFRPVLGAARPQPDLPVQVRGGESCHCLSA